MKGYRIIIVGVLMSILLSSCAASASPPAPLASQVSPTQQARVMTVYKSPTCGCCTTWVDYMKAHGFQVKIQDVANIMPIKTQKHVPMDLQTCHTAVVDGYVVEGHVPVAEVERLLSERPAVAGIAVAGMPAGSPGMEVPDGTSEPFDVMSFDSAGQTAVFAHYPK